MKILYLLIPISIVMVIGAILAFRWAVRTRQFDDMDTAAMMPLLDDFEEKRQHHHISSSEKNEY